MRASTGVGLTVGHLHLCPAHELRLADSAETVELTHGGGQLLTSLLAKLCTEPLLQMARQCRWVYSVDVPRHIQEELQVVGSHLGVVDVDNPQTAAVMVVGRLHLRVDESRLRRRQPQIVVGTAPVREVVVDASPTLPLLLLGIAETRHIAIIVVTPHQRHVIRNT